MHNPWLDIPLADYEAHMALPTVGQAQLIAHELDVLVRTYSPNSVAIIGCAGGNGFDCAVGTSVSRVVGVDINPQYIERARERYEGRTPGLELHIADIQASERLFDPVDLIYVALVLEYVDLARTMSVLKSHCDTNGVLAVLSQLPHERMAHVSPSPYNSLQLLAPGMRLTSQEELQRQAGYAGFAPLHSRTVVATGGKRLRIDEFRTGVRADPGAS
ncbi:MAG TPA: class I SAM-dependent methyltransferase [Steroidobacteraceae bacterium]|jgi:trans-aconitate methyltransferase